MMIETGCPNLDEMIGGGVPSGAMSAIFGQYKIGKTLLALQVACKYSIETGKPVLYLDTEAFFSSKDVQKVYVDFFNKRFNGEAKIDFLFIPDAFEFTALFGREITLEKKGDKMEMVVALKNRPRNMPIFLTFKEKGYGMLVVDSFSNPITTLMASGRRQDLPARANLVRAIAGSMMVLAADYDIPVIHTTHESKDPVNPYDTGRPVLGIYGYAVKTIFQIRYSKGKDMRKVVLFRAPGLMETKTESVVLQIKENIGFVDVNPS